jgi:hypothetical protein
MGLEDARVHRQVGGYHVEIVAAGVQSVHAVWTNGQGKQLKDEPAAVKRTAAQELREVRGLTWDLRSTLATVRTRVDGLMATHRTWSFADWCERYLDHPLVGVLARRLIWQFEGVGIGAWLDGRIVDSADRILAVHDGSRVGLWHPMAAPVESVRRSHPAPPAVHGAHQPVRVAVPTAGSGR